MATNALDWLEAQCGSSCRDCALAPFIRRCLTALGWTATDILRHHVADADSAVDALTARLRQWFAAGAPAKYTAAWKGVRAALLHRVLPAIQKKQVRDRVGGKGWWHCILVCSLGQFVGAWRQPGFCTQFLGVLRCCPPAV